MDARLYRAGKRTGDSKLEKQGASTILITHPGPFDPDTGEAGPLEEQGFQRADIAAMADAAARRVTEAQRNLAKEQANHVAHVELLADIDALP